MRTLRALRSAIFFFERGAHSRRLRGGGRIFKHNALVNYWFSCFKFGAGEIKCNTACGVTLESAQHARHNGGRQNGAIISSETPPPPMMSGSECQAHAAHFDTYLRHHGGPSHCVAAALAPPWVHAPVGDAHLPPSNAAHCSTCALKPIVNCAFFRSHTSTVPILLPTRAPTAPHLCCSSHCSHNSWALRAPCAPTSFDLAGVD